MESMENVQPPSGWRLTPGPQKLSDLTRQHDTEPPSNLGTEPQTPLERYKRNLHNQFIKTLDGSQLRAHAGSPKGGTPRNAREGCRLRNRSQVVIATFGLIP